MNSRNIHVVRTRHPHWTRYRIACGRLAYDGTGFVDDWKKAALYADSAAVHEDLHALLKQHQPDQENDE